MAVCHSIDAWICASCFIGVSILRYVSILLGGLRLQKTRQGVEETKSIGSPAQKWWKQQIKYDNPDFMCHIYFFKHM